MNTIVKECINNNCINILYVKKFEAMIPYQCVKCQIKNKNYENSL